MAMGIANQPADGVPSENDDDDSATPSIYEVFYHEGLNASLRPAIKHIFRIVAEHNPAKFGWIYANGDAIYAAIHLLLENYCLQKFRASFSENFYGLQRVPLDGKFTGKGRLPIRTRLKSLLFLVLVPYFKQKCDEYFEHLEERVADGHIGSDSRVHRLYRAFVAAYPYIHAAWEGAMLLFQCRFMFGQSRHHSPFLPLAGVKLCMQQEDEDSEDLHKSDSVSGRHLVLRLLTKLMSTVGVGLMYGMSVGAFLLQFMEWWYYYDYHGAGALTALPTPDPPKRHLQEGLPKMNSICPLCNRVRTNHTVLAVTGYVFCYPCIYRYVTENQSCPVTGYSANTDHLVRLFTEDDV